MDKLYEQLSPKDKFGFDPELIKQIPINEIHILLVCKTEASCVPGYEILNVSPRFDKPQLVALVYDYHLANLFADAYLDTVQ